MAAHPFGTTGRLSRRSCNCCAAGCRGGCCRRSVSTDDHGAALFLPLECFGRVAVDRSRAAVVACEAAGREASPGAGVIDTQSVKPLQAAARGGLTQAGRSRDASAMSSPTRKACWSAPSFTPPICRIETAHPMCLPPSAIASPGCATSLPTAAMLATLRFLGNCPQLGDIAPVTVIPACHRNSRNVRMADDGSSTPPVLIHARSCGTSRI